MKFKGNRSALESLETRRLLSSSFASVNSNGTLSVVGTSKADTITVQTSGSKVQAILNGATESFAASAVKRIWADGYSGDDTLTNKTSLPATLSGGTGKDRLVVGSGQTQLYPGDYSDSFSDAPQNGQAGDTIDYTSDQPGKYVVQASADDASITRPNATVDNIANGYLVPIDIHFTSGNDQVTAQEGDDYYGRWRFFLGSGNDSFTSASGIDYVDGEAGNDTFKFNYDAVIATVLGGSGDDIINDDSGYSGTYIDGGSGFDTENLVPDEPIKDQPSVDYTVPAGIEKFSIPEGVLFDLVVHGNDLDNIINVVGGNVTVDGNGGNDQITATVIDAGTGVSAGRVSLDGGSGNDLLHGVATNASTLKGGSGNDTLIGDVADHNSYPISAGSFTYEGDSGTDTADFSGRTDNLNITLDNKANDGGASENSNVEADVENVIGGSGNDYIAGNPSANSLEGGAGDDTIWGSSGNDTLVGDAGHDQLHGQDDNDTLIGKDGQTDTLDGGNGTDKASRDNSASVKDQVLSIESFI